MTSLPDDENPYATRVAEIESCFEFVRTEIVGKKKRNYYRCMICFANQNEAKAQSYRGIIDNYYKEEGGEKRAKVWEKHVNSERHQYCVKVAASKKLTSAQKEEVNPFKPYVGKEHQEIGNLVARLLPTVYNDAKRGTLSATEISITPCTNMSITMFAFYRHSHFHHAWSPIKSGSRSAQQSRLSLSSQPVIFSTAILRDTEACYHALSETTCQPL